MRKRRPGAWSRSNARRFFAGAALAALVLCLFAPLAAEAASRVWPTGYWGPILSCTGNYYGVVPTGGNGGPTNTCNSFCDLLYTTQNAIDFAITAVIFVGAPAMVTFGGILYLIAGFGAGGESDNRKLAKDIIVSALIGVGITLFAYLVISTFLWLFGNGPGSAIQVSWPDIQCNLPPTP